MGNEPLQNNRFTVREQLRKRQVVSAAIRKDPDFSCNVDHEISIPKRVSIGHEAHKSPPLARDLAARKGVRVVSEPS